MPQYAKLPDGNYAAFPDDWDHNKIDATLRKDHPDLFKSVPPLGAHNLAQPDKYDPTDSMSTFDKVAAGAGKSVVDMGRGAQQILSHVPVLNKTDMFNPSNVQSGVDESKKLDAPLMATTSGKVGNVLGSVAAGAVIPGAGTLRGAMGVGAAMGALQPTSKGESRGLNIAAGAAGGAAGKFAGDKIGSWLSQRVARKSEEAATRQSQNSVRDATLSAAQKEGYVVTPPMAGAGVGSRLLSGVSGKFKSQQLAEIKNQDVTERLVRKEMGLPKDAPITSESMQQIRAKAYQDGYVPVKSAGIVSTDAKYNARLDDIVAKYKGASNSFPDAVKSDVNNLVDSFRVKHFDAADAIDAVQILRDDASKAFKTGDNALGKANLGIAKAIEDKIERQLAATGKQGTSMLKGFRDARTLMAKAHTVEDAIQEGSGRVNPQKFAARVQAEKPMTGAFKTIGEFANVFKDVNRIPKETSSNPFTIFDYGVGGLMGAASHNPLAMAGVAARPAARHLIMSKPYQKLFVHPSYGANSIAKPVSSVVNSSLGKGTSASAGAKSSITLKQQAERDAARKRRMKARKSPSTS